MPESRLFKVKYFVWGEPAFTLVIAYSEEDAIEYSKKDYDEYDNFQLISVKKLDTAHGVKVRIYEP